MAPEPIAAIAKAQSLLHFAASQGAPIETFKLVLSDQEAMDLLDYTLLQNTYNGVPNQRMMLDVQQAHDTKNPWPVVAHFHLLGFEIIPPTGLN